VHSVKPAGGGIGVSRMKRMLELNVCNAPSGVVGQLDSASAYNCIPVEVADSLKERNLLRHVRPYPIDAQAPQAYNQQPLQVVETAVLPLVLAGRLLPMEVLIVKGVPHTIFSEMWLEMQGGKDMRTDENGDLSAFTLARALFVRDRTRTEVQMFRETESLQSRELFRQDLQDPLDYTLNDFPSNGSTEEVIGVGPTKEGDQRDFDRVNSPSLVAHVGERDSAEPALQEGAAEELIPDLWGEVLPESRNKETDEERRQDEADRNKQLEGIIQQLEQLHEKNPQRWNHTVVTKLSEAFARMSSVRFDPANRRTEEYRIEMRRDLEEAGRTRFSQARRAMTPEKERAAREFINEGIEQTILESVKEPAFVLNIHNLVFVRKKNGTLRVCGDFRDINRLQEDDKTPIPSVQEILDGMDPHAKVFIVVDVSQAYFHVPLHPESRRRTVFYGPGGTLFQYRVMPMGLKNAPGRLRREMVQITAGLEGIQVYFDDIIVEARDTSELAKRFEALVDRLFDAGMVLSLPKCQIGEQVQILGWVRNAEGFQPDPEKLRKLQDMPRPRTVQEVQMFLGLVRFLADSTGHLDKVLAPLNKLTRKNRAFVWTEEEERCWTQTKLLVTNYVVRHVPDFERPFHLYTDASQYGMGGFLGQPKKDGGYDVLFCFARAFTDIQTRYSVIEKECLAILTGIDRAAPYVADRHFWVYTDHRPLVWLVGKNNDSSANGRLQRWIQRMARFDFEVVYIPGPKNIVADALSRMGVECPGGTRADRDLKSSALESQKRKGKMASPGKKEGTPQVEVPAGVFALPSQVQVDDEMEVRSVHGRPMVGNRFYVTAEQKAELMRLAHDHPLAGHRGRDATLYNLRTVVWDGNMAEDVAKYVAECAQCQRAKQRPVPPFVDRAWEPEDCCGRWHMDLVEMVKNARGHEYLVTLCDALSKYVWGFPVPRKTAECIVDGLFRTSFLVFGFPTVLVTDSGKEFCNALNDRICVVLGVQRHHTTPYRPAANGQIERQHRTLAAILRTIVHPSQSNWEEMLPYAFFAMNTTRNRATGFTPHFLMFGREAQTLVSLALPAAEDVRTKDQWARDLEAAREAAREYDAKTRNVAGQGADQDASVFAVGDIVLVRFRRVRAGRIRKLSMSQQGPYRIEALSHGVSATLRNCHIPGDVLRRHVSDLVMFKGDAEDALRDDEWEVNEILAEKKFHGQIYFLVTFAGFPEPEWVCKSDLDAPQVRAAWNAAKQNKRKFDVKGIAAPRAPVPARTKEDAEPVVVDHIVATCVRDGEKQHLCVIDVGTGPDDYVWLREHEIRDFEDVAKTYLEEDRVAEEPQPRAGGDVVGEGLQKEEPVVESITGPAPRNLRVKRKVRFC
jgi:transposase InsO family protein